MFLFQKRTQSTVSRLTSQASGSCLSQRRGAGKVTTHQLSNFHQSHGESVFWIFPPEKFYMRVFLRVVCALEGWFSHPAGRQFLCSLLGTALLVLVSCQQNRRLCALEKTLWAFLLGRHPKVSPNGVPAHRKSELSDEKSPPVTCPLKTLFEINVQPGWSIVYRKGVITARGNMHWPHTSI